MLRRTGRSRCGDFKVLPHRQRRKDPAPLRNEAHPELMDPVCGQTRDVGPVEHNATGPRGREPTSERHSVVLPTPLRPSTAVTVPCRREGDPLQHMTLAVVGVHVADV